MFKEVLLFALIGIALGVTRPHSKLERKTNYKIVGGDPANIADFPYQVSIEVNGRLFCVGFLIAPDWVVTAGMCVLPLEDYRYTVRAGSNYTEDGGKVYDVSQAVLHPDYNNFPPIALLKLSASVDPSLGSAIELPEARQPVPENSNLVVTGYEDKGSELRQVTVQSVNREICRKAYSDLDYDFNNITDNMFCAGYFAREGKGFWVSDQGGPAVLDGKVVGMVSYQLLSVVLGYPGIFIQISDYVDWINEYVKL